MAAERGNLNGAVFALVLVAVGITAAIDRFGTPLPLPNFLAAVPLAAGLASAIGARSLVHGDVVGTRPLAAGSAPCAILISALAFVAAPIAIGLGGVAGLVLVACFLAGGAIALFGVAPALGRTGAATIAGAVRSRFGPAAGLLAALACLAALLPLLAAEAGLVPVILSETLGLTIPAASHVVIGAAVLAALAGGRRSAMAMAAGLLPVLALAFLVPVAVAEQEAVGWPLPWLAMFDGRAFAAPTAMPASASIVLALLLIVGIAVLPTLATPVGARAGGRRWTFVLAAAVLLAAPAYALYGRLAGIDPATDPAGLVLNFAAYTGLGAAPALLLASGLVAAAAVALALGLATFGAIFAEDVYARHGEPSAPPGRRAFIARLAILAAGIAAARIGHSGAGIATLAALGLSFAAAGLGPLLLAGWNIPTTRSAAATATISAGLAFVALNGALAAFAPGLGAYLGMGRIAQTVLGPTGWLGLPLGASGSIGAVIGLAVLLTMTFARRGAPPAVNDQAGAPDTLSALAPTPATHSPPISASPSAPQPSSNPGVLHP
ncbi:Na+(or H+)/acetate symporter ActP [Kaistia soli DSM 19436]|uniref:Na+(Or H+)/acetate symporter ActP n=1 Tax=Kaistia soli DSM 19436 TaxID=1122133 RepID=A0A1M5LG04_9HYPH|nr:hypothetical protein [Kaistia soli]SHG63313.1 Na+(or H+)/acetate symporter ActP [Kaistia soli DSM 19436]